MVDDLKARLRNWSNGPDDEPPIRLMQAAADRIEELESLLRRVEPHLDAIICYASTMGEHEPNRIARDVRATLSGSSAGKESPDNG